MMAIARKRAFLVSVGLIGGAIALGIVTQASQAQDDPGGAAASNTAQAGEAADPMAEFDRLFTDWKAVIVKLQDMRVKFRTAAAGEKAGLGQQWKDEIARGTELLSKLRDVALAVYKAAPNKDSKVSQFLLSGAVESFNRDDYDSAWDMAEPLVTNQAAIQEAGPLREMLGVSAFARNDYDSAEKYLKEADAAGALKEENREYLDVLTTYRELWAKEQATRAAEAQADDLPRVTLHTSQGDIQIELFENEAPNSVANFISLIEKKFYDGTVFHRVLPGFMAQGGDPTGTGSGGPGHSIACECYQPNHRSHFHGSLSMAHGGRDTGGSQFYLTFRIRSHLNGKHTVFGRVIEGFDVLAKLQRIDPAKPRPLAPDKIVTAEVVRKREHPYEPEKLPER